MESPCLLFPSAFNGTAIGNQTRTSSAMKIYFEGEIGAQPPIGVWDLLGLVADGDHEGFDCVRYVGIEHGHIAMLAVLGHIVQLNYRLSGLISFKEKLAFADVPNGLAAFSKIPPLGTLQIILATVVHELFVLKQVEGSFPGDMTIGQFLAASWMLYCRIPLNLTNGLKGFTWW
ncbi:unnamed protein product [Sphacelaria rigidula]